jgi:hypothetical protein
MNNPAFLCQHLYSTSFVPIFGSGAEDALFGDIL